MASQRRRNLVVDLGGTRVRVALADDALRLYGRSDEPTDHRRGPESVIDQIVRMLRVASAQWSDLGRLAVASPGPLNSKTGMVYDPPNMPGWQDVPLGPRLAEALGVPALIVNDANAAALGEFHAGSGRGFRHLVYLTISTGIGGGVVIDGRLLEGTSGTAGEIGHMTIDRHGPPCPCGSVGCLEMLASGTSIARRFREAVEEGGQSALVDRMVEVPVTAADIAHAAEEGDHLAGAIFTDACRAIGFGVVNCVHIFNPDIVALGGGVTHTRWLFDIVREVVERHTFPVPRAAVRIVPAELGDDVGLIGAAAAARAADGR